MTAAASVAGFVWDPRLAAHVYRAGHPLKPRRLRGVHDPLVRLGAFSHPNARLLAPRDATRAELERVHDGAYVDAVAQASADPDLDYAEWGLHTFGDTPPFAGMHEASLLTTGATLVAMEAVVSGRAESASDMRARAPTAPSKRGLRLVSLADPITGGARRCRN